MKWILFFTMTMIFIGCSTGSNKPADSSKSEAAAAAPGNKHTPPSNDSLKKVACSLGSDKRELEVTKKESGCELFYTKFGKKDAVASSQNGLKHCNEVFERITKKLEALKYTCN